MLFEMPKCYEDLPNYRLDRSEVKKDYNQEANK